MWSLLAAVGLFVVGGTVSVWRGVSELFDERAADENYVVAYVVLGIALVMEGISWTQAVRQLRTDARSLDREVLEYAMQTSDPTVRAVFAEDSAALVGIVLATTGIGLHQLTGVAAWDAVGSILVGVLLGVVAVLLIDRNRRFLTGEPGTPQLRDAVLARIEEPARGGLGALHPTRIRWSQAAFRGRQCGSGGRGGRVAGRAHLAGTRADG